MSDVQDWDEVAANNDSPAPDGFPEGMFPSQVNDSAREVMAGVKRFYDQLTDPQNPAPITVSNAGVADTSKTLRHSADPENPDVEPLEEDNGDWYVNRANHFGTIDGSVISPQPNDNIGSNAGLGLNAATLQGLTANQLVGQPINIEAPNWMLNLGKSVVDRTVDALTLDKTINAGTHYFQNLTIDGATLSLNLLPPYYPQQTLGPFYYANGRDQLIIVVNDTFSLINGGSIDVSGFGGIGGYQIPSQPDLARGEGDPLIFIGGAGGNSSTGGGNNGGATRWGQSWLVQGQAGAQSTSASGSLEQYHSIVSHWNPFYKGGSGGGASSSFSNRGGDGGGVVIIIAKNFIFDNSSNINANGATPIQPPIYPVTTDLRAQGCGGGGVIITAAQNTINNSGSRLVSGAIPSNATSNAQTMPGGNGWSVHYSLAP